METITKYLHEVQRGIDLLVEHPKTLFVGQAVRYNGTAITQQLKDITDDKKLEFPVAEQFQMGFSIGLALEGYIPISIFPRVNFLFLAIDQLINHLDKWTLLTQNESKPKVIIKVCIGSEKPLDPSWQHKGNYTAALKKLCKTIEVIELKRAKDIYPAYDKALNRDDGRSTILVEHSIKYAYGSLYRWK